MPLQKFEEHLQKGNQMHRLETKRSMLETALGEGDAGFYARSAFPMFLRPNLYESKISGFVRQAYSLNK